MGEYNAKDLNAVVDKVAAWKKKQVDYQKKLVEFQEKEDKFYASFIAVVEENFNDFLGLWRPAGEEETKKQTTTKPSVPVEPTAFADDDIVKLITADTSKVGFTKGAGTPTFG